MYDDLEQTLARELDGVATGLDVPPLPPLPATGTNGSAWARTVPLLAAAAAVIAVLATVVTLLDRPAPEMAPAPAPSAPADTDPVSTAAPDDPVVVGLDLHVGGEQVPGQWYVADGRGSRWVGQRTDGTWWWGYDAQPQRLEGAVDQPPVISPNGGYQARVLDEGSRYALVGADTEPGGEGFGAVPLPRAATSASRVVAVTDDGLVVARGPGFQWLWRPLLDAAIVDLEGTAPDQVVIGATDAGLIVDRGGYDAVDGTVGEPYLARLKPDGTLTRIASVPRHDVLEGGDEWVAWVPPGTVEGEASATAELEVQRLDGSAAGALTAPEGWLFLAPGFGWESRNRLLARVVTPDGGDERLARCRPEPASCVLVDLP